MGKKFYAMMAVLAFAAGGMDVNAVYTLDGIEVSADRQKDRFGNMITEQSYYRTGGDVQVIDCRFHLFAVSWRILLPCTGGKFPV